MAKELNLDKAILECYDLCDDIERSGIVKDRLFTALRNVLKNDLLRYLGYISSAFTTIDEKEAEFIQKYLGIKMDSDKMANLRCDYNLIPSIYGNQVPMAFKYFVLADAKEMAAGINKKNKRTEKLTALYKCLGQAYVACDDDLNDREIHFLSIYNVMLDEYLHEYGIVASASADMYSSEDELKRSLMQESEPPEPLDVILTELNSLVGLKSVKEDVNGLINFLKVQKIREQKGMKFPSVSKHLVFSGNPGTGKTTVARLLARVYRSLGILESGHFVEVDRSGLVSGFVGQTAIKTAEVIESAKGGVLFIDEAYSLVAGRKEGDFGQEAIDTILKAMEDNRDNLIVIVAGYTDLMEEFLDSNPGLRSRFNKYIFFENYSSDELMDILVSMSTKQDYEFSEDAKEIAKQHFDKAKENKNFANAREVRNFFERCVNNQASRIVGIDNPNENDLRMITKEDVLLQLQK